MKILLRFIFTLGDRISGVPAVHIILILRNIVEHIGWNMCVSAGGVPGTPAC